MAIETAVLSAEAEASGVKINLIPREGGNQFNGLFIGSFTNHSLQSDNLTVALKLRGLTSATTVKRAYDVDPAVGGPIVKDRLWFWGSVRQQNTEQTLAGIYFNQ